VSLQPRDQETVQAFIGMRPGEEGCDHHLNAEICNSHDKL